MITKFLSVSASAILFALASLPAQTQEPAKPKFGVKIQDEKTVVATVEDTAAVDPAKRINFMTQGNFFANINTLQGQTLHLSHFPQFLINGRSLQPGQLGRIESANVPLPKSPSGKQRVGFTTVAVIDNIRITQVMELHPSKSKGPGQKRLLNNVLISYMLENKGPQEAKVAVKVYMDTYVIDNDGCMYASPTTHPGKILDGMILQEKTLPSYLQMLQRPDLNNPGYVAHLSLNVGGKLEKANKLVLTRHGAGGFGNWEMPAMASMGDSAVGLYWPAKDLKPGMKREVGYAYGEGIAVAPDSDGQFQLALGGSFQPGKTFTISAVVGDPGAGQTLSLELPAGMQRLEGQEIQPVAPLADDQEYSTVLWKGRVLQPGQHTIRVRSSAGMTQTKIISVTAEK